MTLCCNVTYLLYCASEMSCVGYGSLFYDLAMWSKKFQNTQLIVDCSLSYTSTFTRQNVPRARKQESYSLYVWCTGAGRDSSVGIATRYGLDGPAIQSSRSQWPGGLRRVCDRSLAWTAASNSVGGMDGCVVCVVQYGQKAKPGQSGQRSTENVKSKAVPLQA